MSETQIERNERAIQVALERCDVAGCSPAYPCEPCMTIIGALRQSNIHARAAAAEIERLKSEPVSPPPAEPTPLSAKLRQGLRDLEEYRLDGGDHDPAFLSDIEGLLLEAAEALSSRPSGEPPTSADPHRGRRQRDADP